MNSTNEADLLLKTLQEHFFSHPIKDNPRYGVAFSGGEDSLALLAAITDYARQNGGSVLALHLDHGIRSVLERAQEFESLQQNCRQLKVSLSVRRCGPGRLEALAVQKKTSLEAQARAIRYQWLDLAIKKYNLDCVLIAHHAQDQAETILARLANGRSFGGLGGIPLVRGFYHRPFLSLPQTCLKNYLKSRGLQGFVDSSNLKTVFKRNFLRLEVFPLLKTRFPRAEMALAESGAFFSQLWSFTMRVLSGLWTVSRHSPDKIQVSAVVFELNRLEPRIKLEALLCGFALLKVKSTVTRRSLENLSKGSLETKTGLLWESKNVRLGRQGDRIFWERKVVITQVFQYLRKVTPRTRIKMKGVGLFFEPDTLLLASDIKRDPALMRVGLPLNEAFFLARGSFWTALFPGGGEAWKKIRQSWGLTPRESEVTPVIICRGQVAAVLGPVWGKQLWVNKALLLNEEQIQYWSIKITTRSDL